MHLLNFSILSFIIIGCSLETDDESSKENKTDTLKMEVNDSEIDTIQISGLEVIKDEASVNRDTILFQYPCNNEDSMKLKRVLTPLQNDQRFSARDGRELLIGLINEEIGHQFDQIDGYSSLFLENAEYIVKDLNDNGFEDLIIKVDPHEGLQRVWVYSNKGCDLRFMGKFQADSLKVHENYIERESSILHEDWHDYSNLAIILGVEDLMYHRVDYIELTKDTLKMNQETFKDQIQKRIKRLSQEKEKVYEKKDEFQKKSSKQEVEFLLKQFNQGLNAYKESID